MQNNDLEKIAIKTSVVTIIINAVLTVFKLFAGIFGKSLAMISDAIHSGSDVLSTFIVIIGVKIAAKAPDKNHEFGHERYECVAAILLSVILFATGVGIGYGGVSNIITGNYKTFAKPQMIALIAALISIVVKAGMFGYTMGAAKRVNSSALKADAWHHLSDSLSSIGSLVGIVGAMAGVLVLDSVASIVICLLILKAAIDIFIDAIKKMTDQACDSETEEKLKQYVMSFEGVKRLDGLMTRLFGNRIYVIAEIACDKNLPLYAAHEIAEEVHDGLEGNFPLVKHITIHVNPYDEAEQMTAEERETGENPPQNDMEKDENTTQNKE